MGQETDRRDPPHDGIPDGILAFALAGLLTLGALASARAADAPLPTGTGFSVDTPRGKSGCRNDASTHQRQVLKLAGKVIYRQPDGPDDPHETRRLADGIIDRNLGCPWLLGSSGGFVVLLRDPQPQDGHACLPLKGVPLFGPVPPLAPIREPSQYLPGEIRLGAVRADVVKALKRFRPVTDPDGARDADRVTIALCGTARNRYMPLFLFKGGRLDALRFESVAN